MTDEDRASEHDSQPALPSDAEVQATNPNVPGQAEPGEGDSAGHPENPVDPIEDK